MCWCSIRIFHHHKVPDSLDQLPDVRPMLSDARRHILAGVHIVFSGVIPLKSNDPTQEPFWQLAEQVCCVRTPVVLVNTCTHKLGAVVHRDVGDEVTHVVARKQGTEKCLWAQQHGRFVVSINWLVFSGACWSSCGTRASCL